MTQRHSAGGHRRRGPRSFLRTYWFEFTVVGLIATGIFLLVERMEIKLTIYEGLVWLARRIVRGARSFGSAGWRLLHGVEVSDLVGIALILIALGLIVWKVRGRAMKRHPRFSECPVCHAAVQRIRSRLIHRLLGLLLRVRIKHYGCSECSFHATIWDSRKIR